MNLSWAVLAYWIGSAHAQVFDTSTILNALTQQINTPAAQTAIKALITITGLASDNRTYEGAAPLGTAAGIDMGIELTVVRIPANLLNDISNATGSSSLSSLTFLPVPRLIAHKGLGRMDLGISYLGFLPAPYNTYQIWGGNAKILLYQPEEGPIWALRVNYTSSSFDLIKTIGWTPQLLVSRPLDFAEPYLGIGYQFVSGSITGTLSQTLPLVGVVTAPINATGTATAFQGFGGVALKLGPSGIKLTLEMAYNSTGMAHLGSKLSVCF